MIQNLRIWTQKILPLVYDDSLSYYEVLAKVVHSVNQVIDTINGLTDDIGEIVAGLIDDKIAEAKQELNQEILNLTEYVNGQIRLVNDSIADLTARLDVTDGRLNDTVEQVAQLIIDLAALTGKVAQVERDYKEADAQNFVVLNNKIEELREEMQHIVLEDVTVINPLTGQRDNFQNVLDYMAYNLRCWALTAGEYDGLYMCAGVYDAFNVSAWDYDYMAKWWLVEKPDVIRDTKGYALELAETLQGNIDALEADMSECCDEMEDKIDNQTTMFSPFRGVIEPIKQVVYEVFSLLKTDSITAGEYDALNLTCLEYQTKNLTAYTYDWHAREYLLI